MRRLVTFDVGDKALHTAVSSAHPNLLTGGSLGRMRVIADYLDRPELVEIEDKKKSRGLLAVHGEYKGTPITAFSTGMATGSVSCTLPEIVEATEEDSINIIRLGTSGALQPHVHVGDLVIGNQIVASDATSKDIVRALYEIATAYKKDNTPTPALRQVMDRLQEVHGSPREFKDRVEEVLGTRDPHKYAPYTNTGVQAVLYHTASQHALDGQEVHVGRTQAVSEIYLNALLAPIRDHGDTLAVSMEMSAICGIRDQYELLDGRDINVGNLLIISDTPFDVKTDLDGFRGNEEKFEERHILAGLDALVELRS